MEDRKTDNGSNFIFNPLVWKKTREKGYFWFVIRPVIIVLIIFIGIIIYRLETVRENYLMSSLFIFVVCSLLLISRTTTWLWMEYKYRRYLNNDTSLKQRDYLIDAANIIRIAGNIALMIAILYITFFGHLLKFF